jgi:predicted short-subunit dehydrogenase-like oxidoreductase (DUF2520 family)
MSRRRVEPKKRAARAGQGSVLRVYIFGAGKVGAGLARALKRAGAAVTLRPQRSGLPTRKIDADILILAIRDRDITPAAEAIRAKGLLAANAKKKIAVVHCAGALGPEALAPLRDPAAGVSVAQMHPMISFASKALTPSLERGQLHVDGDPAAVRAATALGKRLGMTPRTIPHLDRVAYHAAAGLVANGAAALAAGGLDLLERARVPRDTAAAMLGPLLRSVADNIERLGMPGGLTGPVRRGDAAGIERQIQMLGRLAPHVIPFYAAAARFQVPLARSLGEAEPASFDAIEEKLSALKNE